MGVRSGRVPLDTSQPARPLGDGDTIAHRALTFILGTIDLIANIYLVLTLGTLVATLALWAAVVLMGLKPTIHRALARSGLGHRPARVEAALVHYEQVCGACGYPGASGERCPECGQSYAHGGLVRRADADARRTERARSARRRAVWASIAFWLLFGSGWLAVLAYGGVNTLVWGGAYPELLGWKAELGPYQLDRSTNWPMPTGEYTLHVEAIGMVSDSLASGPRQLQDARVQVWIEHDDAPPPRLLDTQDAGRSWPALPTGLDRASAIARAVEGAYRAAGLDDGSERRAAEKRDAATAVAMVLDGTQNSVGPRPLRAGAASGLRFLHTGGFFVVRTPLVPLLPAALAGAAAGGVPLILGVAVAWRAWRKRRGIGTNSPLVDGADGART